MSKQIDLGEATAYAIAKKHGYVGTEVQFAAEMTGAAESARAAAQDASDAEAYAIGKRDGTDVPSTDPAYHNNAKYWSQQAPSVTSIAPAYSASSTYAVGDYVTYSNKLYECTTAITTAEAWNSSHWAETSVSSEVTDLKDDLSQISEVTGHGTIEGYIYTPVPLGIADYTTTENGITITQHADGTITAIGTATANVSFPIRGANDRIVATLENGKTYRLSGCPSGGGSSKYGLDLRKTAFGNISYADYGNGATFTLTETGTYYPHIRIVNGQTVNLTFRPAIDERTVVEVETDILSAKDTVARNRIRLDTSHVTQNNIVNTTTTYVQVYRYHIRPGYWTNPLFKTDTGWTVSPWLTRNDGSLLYPMPNNEPLPTPNAPIQRILDVINTYLEAGDNLVYGNTKTMFSEICTNEIDCSTFVTALLYGITYENSRYVRGSGLNNIFGDYLGDTLLYYDSDLGFWRRYVTDQMAQFFAILGRLFRVPQNANVACAMLQPGDILFSGLTSGDGGKYYGIIHCAMVIKTYPEDGAVLVAQAGDEQSEALIYNNENTVCKTSLIRVNETTTTNGLFCVFARPNYGAETIEHGLSNKTKAALLACFRGVEWSSEQARDTYYELKRLLYNIPTYSLINGLVKINANVITSNTYSGFIVNANATQQQKKRAFVFATGVRHLVTHSSGEDTEYYPIPVPEVAEGVVVTITPSERYLALYIAKYNPQNNSYTEEAVVGWKTGSNTKTFEPASNRYMSVVSKYNASEDTYASEPTSLVVRFY